MDFRFFDSKSIFCHFNLKFGRLGGTPKMSNFGSNFAITWSEVVESIWKPRQNDRQSTSKNFYRWFGGKKWRFHTFMVILPFFWNRPEIGVIWPVWGLFQKNGIFAKIRWKLDFLPPNQRQKFLDVLWRSFWRDFQIDSTTSDQLIAKLLPKFDILRIPPKRPNLTVKWQKIDLESKNRKSISLVLLAPGCQKSPI